MAGSLQQVFRGHTGRSGGGPEGGGEGGVAGLRSIDDLFEDEEEEEEGRGHGDGHAQHCHHPQQQQEQQQQHEEGEGGAGGGVDGEEGQEGKTGQWEGLGGMRGSDAADGGGHAGYRGGEGAQHHQQPRCRTESERLEETQNALRCVLAVGAKAGARGLSKEDVGSVQQVRTCVFLIVPQTSICCILARACMPVSMPERQTYSEAPSARAPLAVELSCLCLQH
eukprot:1153080-Pelagomonas_calceolata.AAC.4